MDDQVSIHVVYDEQIFLLQRHGGISVYFRELIRQFRAHPELGVIPILADYRFRNLELNSEIGKSHSPVSSTLGVVFQLCRNLMRNRRKGNMAQIVHHTFYLPGYLGRFPGIPKVTTLFDMIPEYAKSGFRLWSPHFRKKAYLKRSRAVFSISKNSTLDMRKEYGFSFPVQTTYLGVSSDFAPGLPHQPSLPKKFFLFVGNRDGYKNGGVALEAFSTITSLSKEIFLVLCGGGPLSSKELQMLENLGINKKQVLQRDFSYQELPFLYSNALALLYPTKYEGFGLPLVEAMASGIPVFASSTPINHEIAEAAASYFDPNSSSELAELMRHAISGEPELKAKVFAGLERSKDFSWYRCAELTSKIYKEVLLNGRGLG